MQNSQEHSRWLPSLFSFVFTAFVFWSCGTDSSTGTATKSDTCTIKQDSSGKDSAVPINSKKNKYNSLAQAFTSKSDSSFSTIDLELSRTGQPTTKLTVAIELDNHGVPSGLVSATGELDVVSTDSKSTLSTTSEFYRISLDKTVTLEKSKTYWINLQASYSSNDEHTVNWASSDQNPYEGGTAIAQQTDGKTWDTKLLSAKKDFAFKVGCATASPSPSASPSR